jgi:beta-lactamase superfamily II metal-dependent hydrolase
MSTMPALTVVAYNVLFGDAILISLPERVRGRTTMRHILIDVGNVLAGPGSTESKVFGDVLADVRDRLEGRPVDLYLMTHEHMDHVQGLLRADQAGYRLPPIDYAWLTASASPAYYDRFPNAKKQLALHQAAYDQIERLALQQALLGMAPVRAFLANNNPRRTGDCVEFLRGLPRKKTSFVHRGFRAIAGKDHPFREATFSIWAPEEDTAAYYGRVRPVAPAGKPKAPRIRAPQGVSQEAFDALVDFSRSGLGDSMMAIDRAANNTSLVFALEWRGWRLLFTGDAEIRSWKMMHRRRQLKPVHFLKVGHHASHNGTPPDDLLDAIFPNPRQDSRERYALVSTCGGTYVGVPDSATMERLSRRVDSVITTDAVAVGKPVELTFDGA